MASHLYALKMEENGSRLRKLLIDKGTQAFRETLQSLIKPSNLAAKLNNPFTITKLQTLKTLKIISEENWDLLYPAFSFPDVENFSITLLFTLLQNICGLNQPANGWYGLPPPSDSSISSNIARIRYYRNKVMGHIITTSLDDSKFEHMWQEISEALVGLGIQKIEIIELKYAPLTTHEAYYRGMLKDLQTKPELDLPEWQLQELEYVGHSVQHRSLLSKLCYPVADLKHVGNVRVIFSEMFSLGEGSNETRVYLGLTNDGYGKAVKQMRRDNYLQPVQHEKKILNEFNAKKSNYVVNYYFFERDTGTDYVYLITDLCEESLEKFVKYSSLSDLQKALPDLLRNILNGLADLHSGPDPILHRDLKPSNVLRDVYGKFLIADFGISRMLKNGSKAYKSKFNRGTEYWIPPESYCEDEESNEARNEELNEGRYKKESDVYNAGMVAYYTARKGKHPFGTKRHRLNNMLNGSPVGLDEIKDETLKDLLSWMLNLKPEDRPSAIEALKHPFLMSDDDKFDFLCKVGNQQPIKTSDTESSVVKKLNSKYSNWKSFMATDVYDFFRTDKVNGKMYEYGPSLTECLRLIRNIGQHWCDGPLPQPELFYKFGNHKAFFLKTFPNLPVWVHAAVRSNEEFKNNAELKNFFNESEPR
ncbi:serine/threonine-protein kinase/endoribonuclease IRE1-like [Xenia sp. Carnegie-2017]|uniref:serine/threonine-protein kinase/endoribonuclease IRE1-like n=1 Tax=Xenia sp. Carnegie-2017 TaxID=2897299 RepID=UPI001F03E1D9|nr:serine/threonine-protein kinase/endoribonuclease IRE1-like [Xenia sp. Carnegie-2017]